MAESKITSEINADFHRTDVEDDDTASDKDQPKRERKMTEKGRAYSMKLTMKRLDRLCRSLEKVCMTIQDLIDIDTEDSDAVRKHYKQWMSLYEQFPETNNNYVQLLTSEDELQQHTEDWFIPRDQSIAGVQD